ncbi:MAG: hypothetical protein KJN97_15390 [Deltaproteobacteria bacterium]|nr:hypothetical protein [Deltaproteobacteria bacterium]
MNLVECEERLLWDLADLIVYQRAPAMYDSTVVSAWSREALREAEPLEDKVSVELDARGLCPCPNPDSVAWCWL